MYLCCNKDCVQNTDANRSVSGSVSDTQKYIPLRLMVCAHSLCELCVLHYCQQNCTFVKCSICGYNTNITDTVAHNIVASGDDIQKWRESTASGAKVLRFNTELLPLDLYSISDAVDCGHITATKTAEMVDLDLDDDNELPLDGNEKVLNSLAEDDRTISSIPSKVPKTAPKKFMRIVEEGVNTFTKLSQNHQTIKRTSDETKEWFKKLRVNAREGFHRLHSILQIREKEFLDDLEKQEKDRIEELHVFQNEILSKRSELKGRLLHCNQLQNDRERRTLKSFIEQITKDSNFMKLNAPNVEHNIAFNSKVEDYLKNFANISRSTVSVVENSEHMSVSDSAKDSSDISSDDEEEEDSMCVTDDHQSTTKKEIVTVLQINGLGKFFVQKESEKEKLNELKRQINVVCASPFNHPPAIDSVQTYQPIFVFSSLNNCWCRANLIYLREKDLEENEYVANVVLIDYGIEEHDIRWFNVREMKQELFDFSVWPPFAYRCALFNIKLTSDAFKSVSIKLFKEYVLDRQLVMFLLESKDNVHYVDLIHYDDPDVTYTFPTIIQILIQNQMMTVAEDRDNFLNHVRPNTTSIKYLDSEALKSNIVGISVLVSHIETPDLFYVQLQRSSKALLNLIDKMNEVYANENGSKYIFYCPKVLMPCAALYDDGKFYRAIVTKILSPLEVEVYFVDFGNKVMIEKRNLRMLRNEFVKDLPPQAIACSLIHVEPAIGYKWSLNAIECFRYSVANDRGPQILTMTAHGHQTYDSNQRKLMVVLRKWNGAIDTRINCEIVSKHFAISSGPYSRPDDHSEMIAHNSRDSPLRRNSPNIDSKKQSMHEKVTFNFRLSAFVAVKEMLDRSRLAKADKRSSLIKVIPSAIKDPYDFYVQLDKKEIENYFTDLMKDLHFRFSSLLPVDENLSEGYICAFKTGDECFRGQVIKHLNSYSDENRALCLVRAIDFGTEHQVRISDMRKSQGSFIKDGPFALKCCLPFLIPCGGSANTWTETAKDDFASNIKKFETELFILVNDDELFEEPVSVLLYGREVTIPGALERQKVRYINIGDSLVEKGLAWSERINSEEEELNEDNTTRLDDNILQSLQRRHGQPLSSTQTGHLQYKTEVYPKGESEFVGIPTDLTEDLILSFRYFNVKLGDAKQPLAIIERNIETVRKARQLEPYKGGFQTNTACTAYFDYDGTWNRAEILGISEKSDDECHKIIVRFVDYGNINHLLCDHLSSDVFGIDIQKLALKCEFYNLKPVNDEAIPKIRNEIFANVFDKKCKFIWENFPNLPLQATILIPNADASDYTPLKSLLLNQDLIMNEEIDDNVPQEVVKVLEFSDCGRFRPYSVNFETGQFYQFVVAFPVTNNYVFLQAQEVFRPNSKQDKQINDEHDSFIWTLDNIRKNIDSFNHLNRVVENIPCLAQFDDNEWYRGLVIKVHDNETADIFFIDYGNVNKVSFDRLREIPIKFLKPSSHAFLCILYNIRPYNKGSWSANNNLLTTQILLKLSGMDPRLILGKFKSCDSWPFEVDLYLKDDSEKSKLVPKEHALQELIDDKLLEFIDPKEVWRKPIQLPTPSLRERVKLETID